MFFLLKCVARTGILLWRLCCTFATLLWRCPLNQQTDTHTTTHSVAATHTGVWRWVEMLTEHRLHQPFSLHSVIHLPSRPALLLPPDSNQDEARYSSSSSPLLFIDEVAWVTLRRKLHFNVLPGSDVAPHQPGITHTHSHTPLCV